MKSLKFVLPLILILLVALVFINRPQAIKDSTDRILIFTTPTCPHCKVVKDYIADNQIDTKLPITLVDVSNSANANLLTKKAEACQVDTANIGVPFYYYQDECFIGDQPIIDQINKMLQ